MMLVALCLCILFRNAYCQTRSDVTKLYKDLFSNYTKQVKPGDPYIPLTVSLEFYFITINSFREVDEILELTAVFYMKWTDDNLSWNPSSYNNQDLIFLVSSDIWIPPLFVMNRVDDIETFGAGKSIVTSVRENGDVHYSPGEVFQIKCTTDISKFPFDTQTCILDAIPWGYVKGYVTFVSTRTDGHLEYYSPNSDWELLKCSTSDGSYGSLYNKFSVEIVIKRAPLYYTVMVVVPTILFALLNPLVFVLPADSGERIGLAMTILLSYAIFLTLVSASIPASSNPMCLLLIVMVAIISVSGGIAFITIINVRFYHSEEADNIPKFLKALARCSTKRKQEVVPLDKDTEVMITGKDVAACLDKLSFILSYCIILSTIVAYFVFVFL